jgi:hypothetical protein
MFVISSVVDIIISLISRSFLSIMDIEGFTRITKGTSKGRCSHPLFIRGNVMASMDMHRTKSKLFAPSSSSANALVSASSKVETKRGTQSSPCLRNSTNKRFSLETMTWTSKRNGLPNAIFASSSQPSTTMGRHDRAFCPESSSSSLNEICQALFASYQQANFIAGIHVPASASSSTEEPSSSSFMTFQKMGQGPLVASHCQQQQKTSTSAAAEVSSDCADNSSPEEETSPTPKDEEEEDIFFGGRIFFTVDTDEMVTLD